MEKVCCVGGRRSAGRRSRRQPLRVVLPGLQYRLERVGVPAAPGRVRRIGGGIPAAGTHQRRQPEGGAHRQQPPATDAANANPTATPHHAAHPDASDAISSRPLISENAVIPPASPTRPACHLAAADRTFANCTSAAPSTARARATSEELADPPDTTGWLPFIFGPSTSTNGRSPSRRSPPDGSPGSDRSPESAPPPRLRTSRARRHSDPLCPEAERPAGQRSAASRTRTSARISGSSRTESPDQDPR